MPKKSVGFVRHVTNAVYYCVWRLFSSLVRIFLPRHINKSHYEGSIPTATYTPWNKDPVFLDCHSVIRDFTLVDKYKCFELWWLVEESKKLEPGAYIEIGVWKGGSGALIAKKARLCGIRENVYLCDTFRGVVKAGEKDTVYRGGEHSDTSEEAVRALLKKLGAEDNVKILTGIFPDETAGMIQDKAFRFCHIDVDVYQSAKDIVNWIWDKLVSGGLIIFDDYGHYSSEGIALFVEEEKARRKDLLAIHNLNGHAVFIKI
jgi:hypothetical protein